MIVIELGVFGFVFVVAKPGDSTQWGLVLTLPKPRGVLGARGGVSTIDPHFMQHLAILTFNGEPNKIAESVSELYKVLVKKKRHVF